MKRLIIAIAVLILVVGIGITGLLINTNTANSVMEKLHIAKEYATNGNTEQAKVELKKAVDKWEDRMEIMLIFVSHGKLDQIEESINIANAYLEHQEMTLFYAECQRAYTLLNHFENVEYLNINNIF